MSTSVPQKKLKLSNDETSNLQETGSQESIPKPHKEEALQSMMQSIIQPKKSTWKPLVWIDCEMTGLNVFEDHIIEICCIITDGNLEVIDEKGYESTIYYPKEDLDNMSKWCVIQHNNSGLVSKILENPLRILSVVEDELYQYIKNYVEPNKAIMAGNSIYMDKFFMMREFPKVTDYLHYRLLDVSSLMEIGYRHNPQLMKQFPKKQGNHTARSDILESIGQLRWYVDNYLKSDSETKVTIKNDNDKDNNNEVPVSEKTT